MSQKQPVGMAVAKFDYTSVDCHELSITKGEKLTLLDDSQHWWQVMNARGETGYVPSNYCKKSKQSLFSSLRNTLGRKKSKDSSQLVSCGASSVGTAPSAASGRRSTGASPKPVNMNSNGGVSPNSHITNEGDIQNYGHDINNKVGMNSMFNNSSGAVFSNTASSVKSNGSSNAGKGYVVGMNNQKCGQSMSYNVGQQSNQYLGTDNSQYPLQGPTNTEPNHFNAPVVSQSTGYQPHGAAPRASSPPNNAASMVGSQHHNGSLSRSGAPSHHPSSTTPNFTYNANQQVCSAKFSYTPCQPDELPLNRGDKIRVLEKSSDGWWRGELVTLTGNLNSTPTVNAGWFPSNYVTIDRGNAGAGQMSSSGANSLARPTGDSLGRKLQHQSVHHSSMPSVAQNSIINNANTTQAPMMLPQPTNNNDMLPQHPHQYLPPTSQHQSSWRPQQPYQNNNLPPQTNNSISPSVTIARYSTVLTMFPFNKNQPEEMSFQANEILEVLDRPTDDPDWWKCRNSNGDIGLVPTNYVRQLTTRVVTSNNNPPVNNIQMQMDASGGNIDWQQLRVNYNRTGRFRDKVWYWGSISRGDSESMLMRHGLQGQFIVRDSETHPGDLTVTMHARIKCRNFKVHMDGNGSYTIGQKHFPSVEALIQHYRTHPIYKCDEEGEKLYLTDPFQYSSSQPQHIMKNNSININNNTSNNNTKFMQPQSTTQF